MSNSLNVLELFAGVGGFRIGLEESNSKKYKTKWANQWEPSKKSQDAFEVYDYQFPDSMNINVNIEEISDETFAEMDADLIVGGFPCQDYSVARSSKGELGIQGKKGVLFWQIIRATEIIRPKYLILENVDRLLKSPTTQRGRDIAIMLAAFDQLGYSVEWRVINAAEYGRAQRRRRVFIYVYRNDIPWAQQLDEKYEQFEQKNLFGDEAVLPNRYEEYIFKEGLFARQFPIKEVPVKGRHAYGKLNEDVVEVSDNYSGGKMWNTGVMRHGVFYTYDTATVEEPATPLGEIIQDESEIDEKYYLNDEQIVKFEYLRGPKKIQRTAGNGHTYVYSEGGMSPYDDLELPGRTMLTSEGSVNRSTHLLYINERYRFITPIEAERLQDFPDDWTRYKKTSSGQIEEVTDRMRLFFMGNALVTGIVKRIADELEKIDKIV
ncbi:DNA (cytosine-5-)-methyltransferase [Alkalibacterium iburiense]|uniref:Cytosine-specific methyltransferase n=1 Tax=Alkalibacterium iburiense TaxID=290589 RepID=A0ABP3GU67_9LACT